jgi:hypothetical protein
MKPYLFYAKGNQWWIWSETKGEWVCCPGTGSPFVGAEGRVRDLYDATPPYPPATPEGQS